MEFIVDKCPQWQLMPVVMQRVQGSCEPRRSGGGKVAKGGGKTLKESQQQPWMPHTGSVEGRQDVRDPTG